MTGTGDAEGGNRPNPLILPPLLGESKMIQADNLIERLDAEIERKRDREGDMLFLAPPDPLLTACKQALSSLKAEVERLEAERDSDKRALSMSIAERNRLSGEWTAMFGREVTAIARAESAVREAEKLRDVCTDLLSLVKGDLSGPTQMAGVIREAEAAIESPPGRPNPVGQALGNQR